MNTTDRYITLIEESLKKYVPSASGELASVPGMLSYSLEGGGKRVRPVLCLAFCEACGGTAREALGFACAVEFIHTYSLIHDDLPCMDNDDIRRGKPSSHIQFGEANALLAGDALLTRAFGIIAECCLSGQTDAEKAVRAVKTLSDYAGACGMIGGQYIDLKYENEEADIPVLFEMDSLKTSALICSACELGVIAAGGSEQQLKAAGQFGLSLGIAFQIMDDIIEYDEGNRSDAENGKSTYIGLLGYEGAKKTAAEYTDRAVEALGIFGDGAAYIKQLAEALLNRKH